MFSTQLTHTFDAAHRLPNLPGKDANLHGHTWRASVTIAAPTLNTGVLVEFGSYKTLMRDWIDTHLDHSAMLGAGDPLLPALRAEGCRVFVFDTSAGHASSWPTVETVAALIAHYADRWLCDLHTPRPDAHVARVDVAATLTNAVTWLNPNRATWTPA
ncbi:6-carboxytetrahydropterin synthase [Nonomuraea sp. NPDC026600]|uniref:6-pyruvoyl trahydropterin synthase family protein n=1 Tax=Nonomuraea sp. NPDC026600 TaxID=3155363 RepID=UPI0033E2BF0F